MGLLPDKHTYSYSQLSSFDECPYNFYLQKIENIEEPASNAFAEKGSLIHDLLDQWGKKKLTKQQMLTEYERRYPEEVITAWPSFPKGQAQKNYEKGIEFLESFDEFQGYEVISTEEKFKIDLALADGSTRPFVGVIDMLLKDKKTGALIICDHKSKSLSSFKKEEDKMYRQQLLYATYLIDTKGEWPDSLMFHLFNEGSLKMERLFTIDDYRETIKWATEQIKKIEKYTIIDWLQCKEKPDYFCANLCSCRNVCPIGCTPLFRRKSDDEFEEFKGEE